MTLHPPHRLLMGPGPISADPRVLRAMSAPLVGQFDPVMTGYMNATQDLYRQVFRTANDATLLVDGTARAAIEAAVVSLVEPGDRVLVPVFGRFGHLLVEIARRAGARVETVEAPWGQVVEPQRVADAVRAHRPRLVAVVHGDTSTTMRQPLADIGAVCAEHDALLYVDATASLGGNDVRTDDWQLDVVTAGLQKCLGGPSGSAPTTLSDRARDAVGARRHVEEGLRTDDDEPRGTVIGSNYLDLAQLLDYWGPRRLNHHTEATSMLYAAHECARIVLEDGLDATVERHRRAGAAMLAGVQGLGLQVFGDPTHRMHNVVAVQVPDGVVADAVRATMLDDFAIEIGTSFGPLHGRVWRIGTMGYNARKDAVLTTLAALEHVLRRHGVAVPAGGGVSAAQEVWAA
ncbi:pyridoxal-phosphate-dependent aminotransferase family protein [Cellulomonas dongxiuzhuiae]|uniref:Alanine--glyoxylate aminotransferase family protein n=1 Tax=Cellulomonas dongxiuzhuiae TaxID=2819979 RepID=A0ABX8GGV5_9CELL|nr:alanine--glyoxylate aminotransferase family protein [Cellulomonas dongxiuzhuiae]MBO3094331.1 alanine--glyoxylate aminotransferase family protein [Cellulomonas dongxiuzhuiae]QWC15369.1 alanine--glyoxylate aminotransferase family protein [Cellulomonas dongxiuzhuiae]